MNYQNLISTIQDCQQACNECADACLSEDNIKEMVKCIRTDRKCAIVCNATAEVLAIKDVDADKLIQYCKRVCEECAGECAKHDHEHCQRCSEACRKCAEACEKAIGTMV